MRINVFQDRFVRHQLLMYQQYRIFHQPIYQGRLIDSGQNKKDGIGWSDLI